MGSSEKSRVDFNAPTAVVERADAIADLLDISRTQLIIDALTDKMHEVTRDDTFKQRVRDGYFADRLAFADTEALLGTEEAIRLKLLKDSLDREPPVPELAGELPADEEFYDGEIPRYQSEVSSESTAQSK